MTHPPASGGGTTLLRIAPDAAGSVHALLAGQATVLSPTLDASRRARRQGPVEWLVEVTEANVHRLEAIHRLAEEEGVAIRFEASQPLAEPNQAFLDDHLAHRAPHPPQGRTLVAKAGELPLRQFAARVDRTGGKAHIRVEPSEGGE